jgi:hypothetical protein
MDTEAVHSMQCVYNLCNLKKNIDRLEELGLKEYINYFGKVLSGTSQTKEWN